MLTKWFSDSHDFFFTFFFSIFLRHYVAYVSAGFGKVLLALILGCHGRIQRGGGSGGQGVRIEIIWASMREDLSLGFTTMQDSNQPAQLQPVHVARKLKFRV